MPEEVKKPVPPAPVAQPKPNVQAAAPVPPKPAAKPDPTIAQLVTLLDKHGIRFS
jgi:hypothetical protein